MKKKIRRSRKYKTAEKICDELMKIFEDPALKGRHWNAEQFIAFNLWEVLGTARAMADDFLEDPTLKGWQSTKHWCLDDHHFYSLKNFNPRSRREASRLIKDQMGTMMRVSLQEIADRLEILEEEGE